jgi:rhamnose transport system ATP-binding protein
MTLLKLHDVSKSFGAVRALRRVSFELVAGEVHALLGENGAGKSTLIKIATGAHQPDGGAMELFGQPVHHLTPAAARKSGVACIYQQPALFPDLTVAENIGLRLEPMRAWRGIDWKRRAAEANRLLQRIGAAIAPDTEVRTLSMPEQQLVEIACAVGGGAKVLIMDEPTASLTQKEQHLLFRVVRDLRQSGVGIVYISHRLEEIFALADRVTVLRDGESVGTSPVDSLSEAQLIQMMVGREIAQLFPSGGGHAGEVVLELHGLGCESGGIRDIDLTVRAGEIVGLAGLVGAGRTELARVLFGITPADSGEIRLAGKRVRIRSPEEAIAYRIGYLPEDRRKHGVIVEMTIAANISLAVHRQLFPGTWLRREAERELALKSMRELSVKAPGPEAPAHGLSGGNQQKVAFARWLATRPRILILDEPTQGVDVGAKSEVHQLIRDLARAGMAVLMISSDLPEIIGMSDRICVMRAGTIVRELAGGADAATVMAAAVGAARN